MPEQLDPLASEQEELLTRLRPLWRQAQQLESPPPEMLDRAGALYRQNAVLIRPRERSSRQGISIPYRRGSLYAFAVIAVAVLLLLFINTWSTVLNQTQDALPGQALYPVKTEVEQIRLATTLDQADKAELCITLAQTRVYEVQALAATGNTEQVPATLNAFNDLVEKGSAYLTAAATSEPQRVAVLAPELQKTLRESAIELARVAPLAPQAQGALARAIEISSQAEQAVSQALVTATQNEVPPGTETPLASTGTPVPGGATQVPPPSAEPEPGVTNEPESTVAPGVQPQPTNTHRPDNTPHPTNTHKPDNTPRPTHTRKPSNTPRPTNTHHPTNLPGPPPTRTPHP